MRTILLHVCCAPCFSHVNEVLSREWDVVPFFYNPNISPASEYYKRLDELEKYTRKYGFGLKAGKYNIRQWVSAVSEHRYMGERSVRCVECIKFRLDEVFRNAVSMGIGAVCTTLTVSPHKDAAAINLAGSELAARYNVEFVTSDFKKNNGYKRSVEISREEGFYRQSYCGCVYSMLERDRESGFARKASLFRSRLENSPQKIGDSSHS